MILSVLFSVLGFIEGLGFFAVKHHPYENSMAAIWFGIAKSKMYLLASYTNLLWIKYYKIVLLTDPVKKSSL